MTGFWGMETEQVSVHSERMLDGAAEIDDLCTMLMRQIASVAWVGPDADSFRHEAAEVMGRLGTWTDMCSAAAAQLIADVDQQDSASTPDGAGGGFAAGAMAAVDGAYVGAALGAGAGTAAFTGVALDDRASRLGDALGFHDDPTDDIAVLDAKSVTRPDDATDPSSIADLLKNLDAAGKAQGDDATSIRIQEVVGADGETRYIVYVPGSYGSPGHLVGPDRGGNPMDWNQNPGAYLGHETDSSQAVIAAMKAAGIPPGSDVAMVGHSQGGIVASNLAANPSVNGGPDGWNFTDLVTVGSPVENADVPPGTSTINLAHEPARPNLPPGIADISGPFRASHGPGSFDAVPGLDRDPHARGDIPAHRHEVGLPAPTGDPLENHSVARYHDSVEGANGKAGNRIAAFEDGSTMRTYFQDSRVRDTVDVSVSREPGTFRP